MGDRTNVWLTTRAAPTEGIALYSHWGGREMPEALRQALIFGKGRWNDSTYLSRIIVSRITYTDADDETGSGLSPKLVTWGDGYPVTVVALDTRTVHFASEGGYNDPDEWTPGIEFETYVQRTRGYPGEAVELEAESIERAAQLERIAVLEAELEQLRARG